VKSVGHDAEVFDRCPIRVPTQRQRRSATRICAPLESFLRPPSVHSVRSSSCVTTVGAAGACVGFYAEHGPELVVLEAGGEDVAGAVALGVGDWHDRTLVGLADAV
jgi:hypothetical protein